MPGPAGRAALWVASTQIFELSVYYRGIARVLRSRTMGIIGCDHAFPDRPEDGAAHRGHKQRKSDAIGEESGCQQQGAGKQDHRTMHQSLGRIAHILKRTLKAPQDRKSLASDQKRSQNGGHNDAEQSPAKTDQASDLDEKCDLDQGNDQKQQEQTHLDLFVAGPPVDSTADAPYICALKQRNQHVVGLRGSMSSSLIQLLVLAGIALFLILRLRSVLGTRDGFEKPRVTENTSQRVGKRPEFDVIEGGPDHDITDHVEDGSTSAKALAAMKMAEPGFMVGPFLEGARGAYEMILMAFEKGDLSPVSDFLAPEVANSFQDVIDQREAEGLKVEAHFVGVREIALKEATFDRKSGEGDVTVRFVGEMTSVVKNAEGEIVEGNPNEIKRQRDVWTFSRIMGSNDPNWQLVATGE